MTTMISKKVPVQNRYKKFLMLYAAFKGISLSEREIELLDELYWGSEGIVSTESRKMLCKKMSIKDFNLNNYIKKLRDKGLIAKEGEKGEEQIILELRIPLNPDEAKFGILFNMQS